MAVNVCHTESIKITIKKKDLLYIYFDQLLKDKRKSISGKLGLDTTLLIIFG